MKQKTRLWDETTNSSNSFVDLDNELFRRRIFLRPRPAMYVPHTVHCLQISPGTVLVIISEVLISGLLAGISSYLYTRNRASVKVRGSWT